MMRLKRSQMTENEGYRRVISFLSYVLLLLFCNSGPICLPLCCPRSFLPLTPPCSVLLARRLVQSTVCGLAVDSGRCGICYEPLFHAAILICTSASRFSQWTLCPRAGSTTPKRKAPLYPPSITGRSSTAIPDLINMTYTASTTPEIVTPISETSPASKSTPY